MRILIVCSGNTCRSPMAEAVLREALRQEGVSWVSVSSAGLMTYGGEPMHPNSARALIEAGCPVPEDFTSQPVEAGLLKGADLILGLTSAHVAELKRRWPELAGRCRTLKLTETGEPADIGDPYGQDFSAYQKAFEEIKDATAKLMVELIETMKPPFKEDTMRIGLGSDHGGFELKKTIEEHLRGKGIDCVDYGTHTKDSCDYPEYGYKVARAVVAGECDYGILVCGTGIGISLAANKVDGIRCAVVSDTFSAEMSKAHNNANMLALGERVVGKGLALKIVDTWLATEFEGGRHQARVDKIMEIESR